MVHERKWSPSRESNSQNKAPTEKCHQTNITISCVEEQISRFHFSVSLIVLPKVELAQKYKVISAQILKALVGANSWWD